MNDYQVIQKLPTTAAKVRVSLKFIRDHHQLPSKSFFENGKNESAALTEKKQGNEYFGKKNYLKALEHYNRSLCFSPTGSENLSLVYANRSAIYFNTGHYEACMENIELAESHGYPDKLKPKLIKRKEDCLVLVNNNNNQKATKFEYTDIKLTYDPNPKVPCVVKGIKLATNKKFGRHLVATRDFNPGDILTIEKPLCPTLYKSMVYFYCLFCLESNLMNLKPCTESTTAMFCSKKCYDDAMEQFFKYEGPIHSGCNNLPDENCSNLSLFVIRIVMQAFSMFDSPEKLKSFLDKVPVGKLSAFDLDYSRASQKDFLRVIYALKSNIPTNNNNYDQFYNIVTLSAMVYHILMTHSDLKKILRTTEHENFLMELLVDLHFAAHGSANTILGTSPTEDWQHNAPAIKGVGVYPIASLFNHSCVPNVDGCGENKCIMFVTRPIKAGEQLFDSYITGWWTEPQANRDKILAKYGFKCQCNACRNNFYPAEVTVDLRNNLVEELSIVTVLAEVVVCYRRKWKDLEQVKRILKKINKMLKTFNDPQNLSYQNLTYAQNQLVSILHHKPHLSLLLE